MPIVLAFVALAKAGKFLSAQMSSPEPVTFDSDKGEEAPVVPGWMSQLQREWQDTIQEEQQDEDDDEDERVVGEEGEGEDWWMAPLQRVRSEPCTPPSLPSSPRGTPTHRSRTSSVASSWCSSNFSQSSQAQRRLEYRRMRSLVWERMRVHERRQGKLKMQCEQLCRTQDQELCLCRKYAMVEAEQHGRNFFQTKLLRLETEVEYHGHWAKLFRDVLQELDLLIAEKMNVDQVLHLVVIQDGLLPIDRYSLPPHVAPLKEGLHSLDVLLAELQSVWSQAREKAMRISTHEERTKVLKKVLARAVVASEEIALESLYLHEFRAEEQNEFRTFLADERHEEGGMLKQWRRMLASPTAGSAGMHVGPASVLRFIDFMVSRVMKKYSLLPCFADPLRLFTERVIFPSMATVWPKMSTTRELKQDTLFQQQCAWARQLTQDQLGIEQCYQKKTTRVSDGYVQPCPVTNEHSPLDASFPFRDAVVSMRHVSFSRNFVPVDLLHSLLNSICLIPSVAVANSGGTCDVANISADDLFPMVVFVVLQAAVPDIHCTLAHIDRFLGDEVQCFGEVGLAVSLVKAAVMYINKLDKSDYGLQSTEEQVDPVVEVLTPDCRDDASLSLLPQQVYQAQPGDRQELEAYDIDVEE